MRNKGRVAVLSLAVVGVLAASAWVALRAPEASESRVSVGTASAAMRVSRLGGGPTPRRATASVPEPTSADFYAAGRGTFAEPKPVIASVPEPTSADFYAAGSGTFSEPVKATASAPEPTSADFYAAGGGVLD